MSVCVAEIFERAAGCLKSRMLKSLAGCPEMYLFAVFCKIGALERNFYWFDVQLIYFIITFGQSFKLDDRA